MCRSRLFSLALCASLGAGEAFQIVAVERRGLPPFEPEDRIYCLNGGSRQGVRLGDWLTVRQASARKVLGHLRVTAVGEGQAEGRFEPVDGAYPMKGDPVWRMELHRLPELPQVGGPPLPAKTAPKAGAEAPPQEGLLYFLPKQADLSPAGVKKVEAWVQAWGAEGRWVIQVPASKAVKPALQKQRAETLQAALRARGVDQVRVVTEARSAEGKYEPAWLRHWD